MALLLTAGFAGAVDLPDDRAVSAGRWRIVSAELNGRQIDRQFTAMLSVSYAADGTWTVFFKTIPVAEGTSSPNQAADPKSFNMATLGSGTNSGRRYRGIYEIQGNTRRMCFVPADRPLPADFSTAPASDRLLVSMERIGDSQGNARPDQR
ncbi:MAG: TIGR03067 domain-containing protein [Planctomycetia bacterium]|nr:TIGR03067 domain-containing protein [Planctomycetia bacterium]